MISQFGKFLIKILADFCNLLPLWVATEVSCWTQRTTGESTRQCEVAFWRRLKATPPIQDTQVFADSWDTSVIQWNYYFVLEKNIDFMV